MPEIFINGQSIQAREDQTVLQVALENGVFVPSTILALSLARALGTTVEDLFWLAE